MSHAADNGLAEAIGHGMDVPPELESTVRRHQASLSALVASLRSAGMGDDLVEHSVRSLVESYRGELTAAISQIMGRP